MRPTLLIVVSGLSLAAGPVPPAASAQAARWTFHGRDHADLWYAALAQLGLEGIGPLPLYDAGYAAALRAEKQRRAVETRLNGPGAPELRRALASDSAFEILHFVPAYFAAADRAAMLEALGRVADARGTVGVDDPTAQFGAAVVAAVLVTPAARARLGQLVRAVDDEWTRFYRAFWSGQGPARDSAVTAAQALWDGEVAPALAPFLADQGLAGGVVLLSPAVGLDGRIFAGRPRDPGDNVIVARLPAGPPDRAARAAVAAVVKELCAPLASRLVAESAPAGRAAAETAAGRLAVRCGERLLARSLPARAAEYRRYFLEGLGQSDTTLSGFERAYPAEPALLRSLEKRPQP